MAGARSLRGARSDRTVGQFPQEIRGNVFEQVVRKVKIQPFAAEVLREILPEFDR